MHNATSGVRGARPTCVLIASGKGGVGTSSIAALAALSASERGERVLLVDASETAGSMHHLFGIRPTQSLWTLIDSRVRPEQVTTDVGDNLTIVPGGTSAEAMMPTNDHQRRSALTRLAQLYSRFSLVIFDGGSRLDTITAISELADPALLLVTSADRLALAANYAVVKSVSTRRPSSIISVVTNRHGESVAAEACEYLVGACTHFLNRAIDVVGVIPDDPCLQAAVGAGMSVYDAFDGSPAADAVRGVITRFIPSWPAEPPKIMPTAMLSSSLPSSSRRWS
jgi:flagellar biosynthesis protein FlhG